MPIIKQIMSRTYYRELLGKYSGKLLRKSEAPFKDRKSHFCGLEFIL